MPDKPMNEYIDVTVSSIVAIIAGWLLKGVFSPSRKELEDVKQELKHTVNTRAFDKELSGVNNRLDRIETKIDQIITDR
jgi:hypothetical protein